MPLLALSLAVLLRRPRRRLAQQAAASEPRIGYVYPAGGQQGTTFEVTVGGQFLDGIDACTSSRATASRPRWSSTSSRSRQRADRLLREQLNRASRSDGSDVGETRRNCDASHPRRSSPDCRTPANPTRSSARLVTLADHDRPRRAARAARAAAADTAGGVVRTPLVFHVGHCPEVREPSRKRQTANGVSCPTSRCAAESDRRCPPSSTARSLPGDVDRFRFQARKGQQLVAAVRRGS